jgi:hypothetical protein
MRCLAAAVAAAAVLVPCGRAAAATYYVTPNGSDGNPGTSQSSPWRTVAKVNRAGLQPGDTVLFAGGQTFSDAYLGPPASGTAGAPITFGTYGSGQARLTKGIWFASKSYLTFDGLTVDAGNPSADVPGLQSSASGTGSTHIVVQNCTFQNVRLGLLISNAGDAYWTVSNNLIQSTGDSGVLIEDPNAVNGEGGHDLTFTGNTILDTGLDKSITYGKHGIYARSANDVFRGNVIRGFSDDGISLRFRNAVVEGNDISQGPIGIGWFQYDPNAGTSRIAYNRISGTTAAGIYVNGYEAETGLATQETFVIADNTISPAGGAGIGIEKTSGSVVLANDLVTGSLSAPDLYVTGPVGGGLTHDHNLFWNDAGLTTFGGLATAAGPAEKTANPQLDANLAPTAGSPAVDAGTTAVAGVPAYAATCDGALFAYCGSAPDVGARETGAGAGASPTPAAPPIVQLTSTPPGTTTATTATFSWSTTTPVSSVVCSLDGQAGLPCSSPTTYTGLARGSHSFRVTVSSAYGAATTGYDWSITRAKKSAVSPTRLFAAATARHTLSRATLRLRRAERRIKLRRAAAAVRRAVIRVR